MAIPRRLGTVSDLKAPRARLIPISDQPPLQQLVQAAALGLVPCFHAGTEASGIAGTSGSGLTLPFSSNTTAVRNSEEFRALVSLGPKILPLIVYKMLEPSEFFDRAQDAECRIEVRRQSYSIHRTAEISNRSLRVRTKSPPNNSGYGKIGIGDRTRKLAV